MTEETAQRIAKALENISMGDGTPGGLEAITMVLGGNPSEGHNIAENIGEIANALSTDDSDNVTAGLHDIAEAIRELAEAIKNNRTPSEECLPHA
jgi:methyl-accepting chemotaxis protein